MPCDYLMEISGLALPGDPGLALPPGRPRKPSKVHSREWQGGDERNSSKMGSTLILKVAWLRRQVRKGFALEM